jgi:hypothetical protein
MRAARALLRWTALDLARASRVGVATIRRGEIPVTLANEAALRRALETAGINFIADDGGGEGVRFRKPRKAENGLFRPLSFRAFGPDRLEEEKTTIDAADLALRRGLGGRLVRTAVAAGDWGGIERHGSAVVNLLGSGLT